MTPQIPHPQLEALFKRIQKLLPSVTATRYIDPSTRIFESTFEVALKPILEADGWRQVSPNLFKEAKYQIRAVSNRSHKGWLTHVTIAR